MGESTTDLVTLWEAAQRVMATTGDVERATNETVRREWAAIDAELIRLGIPTRDRHGASGPGRAWWTAQNEGGRIIGIWAESYEEAVIELEKDASARLTERERDTLIRLLQKIYL